MTWLRPITPFRVAALAIMVFFISQMIADGRWFSAVEGEGMTVIEFLFLPLILLFIDLVMQGFDVRPRMLFWTQISLLVLVFWAW